MARKLLLLGLLLGLVNTICFGQEEKTEQFKGGVLFYVPFEGSCNASYARGLKMPTEKLDWKFTEGLEGKGVLLDSDASYVSWSIRDNFQTDAGTVSIWLKLSGDGKDTEGKYKYIFTVGHKQGQAFMLYIYSSRLTCATSFKNKEGAFAFYHGGNADISSWTSGEWHQVVVTWDSSGEKMVKKIYVDGAVKVKDEVPRLEESYFPNFYQLILGMYSKEAAVLGTYDQLAIFKKALTDSEIEKLYNGVYDSILQNLK